MKFIEVTSKFNGLKHLISINEIKDIAQSEDMTCFICQFNNYKGRSFGIYTKEFYTDIVKQLKEIIKGENKC